MTPLILQEELIEELRRILDNMQAMDSKGKYQDFNFYLQDTPFSASDEDEDDPFPYVIVRLKSGSDTGEKDSQNKVKVIVIIGIWDNDRDSQGYKTVSSAITKIYTRFSKCPSVKHGYFSGGFNWVLQQDGYYPYYFGVCEMEFTIPAVRREDKFA